MSIKENIFFLYKQKHYYTNRVIMGYYGVLMFEVWRVQREEWSLVEISH